LALGNKYQQGVMPFIVVDKTTGNAKREPAVICACWNSGTAQLIADALNAQEAARGRRDGAPAVVYQGEKQNAASAKDGGKAGGIGRGGNKPKRSHSQAQQRQGRNNNAKAQ
jgi:hypothetical protein